MSAVTSRERRTTAGKRMSSLVGKAQEDDDAFWGHDTWAEDDESGNESFRESDENSEARVDEFDSDFNDSESDHEAEDEAAGAQAEADLQREERNLKRKQKFDVAKAGRELMQKKKGKGKKRAIGDGINAGLVLNFPPAMGGIHGKAPAVPVAAVPRAPVVPKAKKPAAQRRSSPRSPTGKKRSLRAGTLTKSQQAATKRKAATATTTTTTTTKKKQKRFTQEELLLEAATVTEPENERWLLARKRVQQTADDSIQKSAQDDKRGKVICKFRSRRACLNTLTFPEMDHVPEILARKHVMETKKVPTVCVITGKKARYRDPKTMLGYHDIAAFKELRRRFNTGEPLDQRKKKKRAGAGDSDVPMLQAEQQNGGEAKAKGGAELQAKEGSTSGVSSVGGKNMQAVQKTASKPADAVMKNAETAALLKQKVASLKIVAKPAASSSSVRCSPRQRKPSAKAMAAVETVLAGKAPISNVILNMTVPQLDNVASATSTSTAPADDQSKEKPRRGDSTTANGKEMLKSMAQTSAAAAGNSVATTAEQKSEADTSQATIFKSKESIASHALELHNKFKNVDDECDI